MSVEIVRPPGAPIQLRIHVPAGNEPVLAWGGTRGPGPYPLTLIWTDASLRLSAELPSVPTSGEGVLQGIALRTVGTTDRLEVLLREPVYPKLRRSGGIWVLELQPEEPAVASAAPVAAAASASEAPTLQGSPQAEIRPAAAANLPPASGRDSNTTLQAKPGSPTSPAEQLLADFTVNGLRQPDIARAEQLPDGQVLVAAEDWQAARLKPPGQPRVMSDGTQAFALESVAGLRYRVDKQRMSIEVDAPPSSFTGATMDTQQAAQAAPPRPAPGVFLNYDVSVAQLAGAPSTSAATLEAVGFGPFGTAVTSALVKDDGQRREFVRLDSYWQYDMPQSMQTLVLGDTVGVAGGWSRPVRYGGLRWGRDFGLRPGLSTMPLPSVAGEAALPSTVDLLVNDSHRFSQSVRPGPFDITNVPVITGAGELNLVVQDLLGRQTVLHQSYYASPRLLAPGLSDFSVETGWLRTGFGTDSRYGDAFGAATGRRGITPNLTTEGRVELQHDRQASGFELAGLLGTWGVGRLAVAGSRDRLHDLPAHGGLVQVGIERSSPLGGGALQYEYATRGFAPFGESPDPAAPASRSREQLLASIGGRVWGSLNGGISYARRVQWDGEHPSTLGFSLNIPIGSAATLTLTAAKQRSSTSVWTGSVNLNVPLGNEQYIGSRVERQDDGHTAASVLAVRNPPAGPGLGWQAEVSSDPRQRARGGVQYNTNHADLTAEVVTDADARVSSRGGARGTLGLMAGLPFASRPVGEGSFAVVELEGLPDVPIKRSNQVVAQTDSRGLAFVPGLVPWQKNVIEIDAADLPLDVETQAVVQELVPYARSGALVHFDVRRTRQALLVLHQANGQPVPRGARVRLLPAGAEFEAGLRGEVWLTDLAADQQRVTVSWQSGQCELDLRIPPSENGAPASLGPLVCDGRAP
ncbi:fimbria/pilus outer membrane usher protein [Ramlibacter sp.]|uniref:fimbria/pilus outer membrane usher protein n=1 Tax=Ramlibacter sp. TaxID=1917967 RepID=UPI0026139210|nr:fimbria/pilus outer membrane usher protein [Ramlibacter sp.]MDB5953657.1 hypothetical protein [Ramlibacter sp.]